MISCPQYDYVEIACMFKFPVQITLQSGELLTGMAEDTRINNTREECLALKMDRGEEIIIMTDIKKLKVMIDNPHFSQMEFE